MVPLALAYMLFIVLAGSIQMHEFCRDLPRGLDATQVYARVAAKKLRVGPEVDRLEDAAWVHDPGFHSVHLCRLNFDGPTLISATYELGFF